MSNPNQPRRGGKFARRTEPAVQKPAPAAETPNPPEAPDTVTAEAVPNGDAVADAATAAVERVEANLSVKGLPSPKAQAEAVADETEDTEPPPLRDPGSEPEPEVIDGPPPAPVMGGEEVGEIVIDALDDIAGQWREKARMSPNIKKTARRATGALLANVGFGAGLLLCVCAGAWAFAVWVMLSKEQAEKKAANPGRHDAQPAQDLPKQEADAAGGLWQ